MPLLSLVLAEAAPAPPPVWLAVEVPSSEMALPDTETGAAAAAWTWLPPRMPELSVEVAALAAAAPPISRKPADRTPTFSDLRTQVFIVGYWPFEIWRLISAGRGGSSAIGRGSTCRRAPGWDKEPTRSRLHASAAIADRGGASWNEAGDQYLVGCEGRGLGKEAPDRDLGRAQPLEVGQLAGRDWRGDDGVRAGVVLGSGRRCRDPGAGRVGVRRDRRPPGEVRHLVGTGDGGTAVGRRRRKRGHGLRPGPRAVLCPAHGGPSRPDPTGAIRRDRAEHRPDRRPLPAHDARRAGDEGEQAGDRGGDPFGRTVQRPEQLGPGRDQPGQGYRTGNGRPVGPLHGRRLAGGPHGSQEPGHRYGGGPHRTVTTCRWCENLIEQVQGRIDHRLRGDCSGSLRGVRRRRAGVVVVGDVAGGCRGVCRRGREQPGATGEARPQGGTGGR